MTRYVKDRREDIKILSVADMFKNVEDERDEARRERDAVQAKLDALGVKYDAAIDIIEDKIHELDISAATDLDTQQALIQSNKLFVLEEILRDIKKLDN